MITAAINATAMADKTMTRLRKFTGNLVKECHDLEI